LPEPHPDVLNISLEGPDPVDIVAQQIKNSLNLLVVVAAGNSGDDLANTPHYPASLGGNSGALASQVITVSAHDPSGKLLTRSNFGLRYSDVAAPGCAVSAISADGQVARFNGSSVAAPLVTFTTILLHSYGLTEPRAIKERILDSVDVTGELYGKVVSGGKLNIPKALSLVEDVVEIFGDDRLHTGIAQLPDPVGLCGKLIPKLSVRKIAAFPSPGKPGAFTTEVVHVDALNNRLAEHCEDAN